MHLLSFSLKPSSPPTHPPTRSTHHQPRTATHIDMAGWLAACLGSWTWRGRASCGRLVILGLKLGGGSNEGEERRVIRKLQGKALHRIRRGAPRCWRAAPCSEPPQESRGGRVVSIEIADDEARRGDKRRRARGRAGHDTRPPLCDRLFDSAWQLNRISNPNHHMQQARFKEQAGARKSLGALQLCTCSIE